MDVERKRELKEKILARLNQRCMLLAVAQFHCCSKVEFELD